MDTLTHTELGPYRLDEVIRRGGMATVYKAYQPSLNRSVAVKVLEHHQDERFIKRFKIEAQLVAQLQHPNILQVYDYGEQGGLLYLVCPYIENGASLADVGKPMPLAAALEVMQRILAALEYAHGRGIVHRDVKPSNVLLPAPDWPLLADFGIVKLLDSTAEDLTAAGQVIGTAAYMAPEQAAGEPVDARTDLYAAGVVLYELVTGQAPFGAGPRSQVLNRHISEPPPAPRSINPTLPAAVESILLRALAKRPGERYQSAGAMAADLKRLNAQEQHATGSATEAATAIAPSGIAGLRSRWTRAALVLGLLVVVGAAGVLVWRGVASPADPSPTTPSPGSAVSQGPGEPPSPPAPKPDGGTVSQAPGNSPSPTAPKPDDDAASQGPGKQQSKFSLSALKSQVKVSGTLIWLNRSVKVDGRLARTERSPCAAVIYTAYANPPNKDDPKDDPPKKDIPKSVTPPKKAPPKKGDSYGKLVARQALPGGKQFTCFSIGHSFTLDASNVDGGIRLVVIDLGLENGIRSRVVCRRSDQVCRPEEVSAPSPSPATTLSRGVQWTAGANDVVLVENSRARLVFQADGNLVLRSAAGEEVWNSDLASNHGKKLAFQTDGNLVIYDFSNNPVWSAKVAGQGITLLKLDGCMFSLKTPTETKWSRGAATCPSDTLTNSWSKPSSGNLTLLRTPESRLVWQRDGNLVLYTTGGAPVWASNTHGSGYKRLAFQNDGNLVIYDASNTALWSPNTWKKQPVKHRLRLGNHCKLTIENMSGQVLWTGNDSCR